ncbi:MAG TPA: sugar ABC transporter substrate-binding protein [Sedimentisphaerales bacterium]|nr:sugar ABC transporter substrate-binding protein [Sedimentisphaerales bacterium]HQG47612.1 sugar ABC transporter substrate-binding protein [Sedimentisphaerales bacterium]HQI27322.1 sugar ABC transporter substrate-binding protein [Sedimentisphaerales bacterium]
MKNMRIAMCSGLALLTIAVGAMIGGCRKQDDRPKVVLLMKSLANEFFKTMEEGALAHAREHEAEYSLKVIGMKNETDVAEQIRNVELIIAQGADAIVIAPADSKALVPVCKKAMDAGIIVVNIDNKFDADVLKDKGVKIPFVGPDNRKGAKMAGVYLSTRLQAGDKVAIIEGAPNAYNGIQRKMGFDDAMNGSGMNIVSSQTGYWETDKARPVAAALINEYPDLKAILCANDSMALGAVTAVKEAGKTGAIYVVGFDNIAAVRQLVKEGKILCTVDQHADQLARFGIEYALEMLKTKAPPADKETPVDLVTAELL